MITVDKLLPLFFLAICSFLPVRGDGLYLETPMNKEYMLCLEFHPDFFRNNNGSLIFGALAQACDQAGKVVAAQTPEEKQAGIFSLFGTAFNLGAQLSQEKPEKKEICASVVALAEAINGESVKMQTKDAILIDSNSFNEVFALDSAEKREQRIIELCNDEAKVDDFLYSMQKQFQKTAIKKIIQIKEGLAKNFKQLIQDFSHDTQADFPSLQELDSLGIMPQEKVTTATRHFKDQQVDLVTVSIKKITEVVDAEIASEIALTNEAKNTVFGVISAFKGTIVLSEALCDLLLGDGQFADDLMKYEPLFIEELLVREPGRDRAEFTHKAFRYPGVATEMIDEVLAGLMFYGCDKLNKQIRSLFTATYNCLAQDEVPAIQIILA